MQNNRYDKLRLDKNENCVGWPIEVIRDILKDVTPEFLAAYPEPVNLYKKIAKLHNVEPDQVQLTTGSEMSIRYLLEAYMKPGDEILVLNPSFAMFEVYSGAIGANIKLLILIRTSRFHLSRLSMHFQRRQRFYRLQIQIYPTVLSSRLRADCNWKEMRRDRNSTAD